MVVSAIVGAKTGRGGNNIVEEREREREERQSVAAIKGAETNDLKQIAKAELDCEPFA